MCSRLSFFSPPSSTSVALCSSCLPCSVFFATGSDSPVKLASSTLSFLSSISLQSAGALLPIVKCTMSPGTSSLDSKSSISLPSLKTVHSVLEELCSASSALPALLSMMTPRVAFKVTMTRMVVPAAYWPSAIETTQDIMSRMTRRSLNCSRMIFHKGVGGSASSRFGPTVSRRSLASSLLRPTAGSTRSPASVSSSVLS